MERKEKQLYVTFAMFIYAILNTAFLFINYLYQGFIPEWLLITVIAISSLLYIFVSKDIKFNQYLKQMIVIYILLFTIEVIMDTFFINGTYSVYNNLMIALNPPVWVITLDKIKGIKYFIHK